jgi:hypothetical protein
MQTFEMKRMKKTKRRVLGLYTNVCSDPSPKRRLPALILIGLIATTEPGLKPIGSVG